MLRVVPARDDIISAQKQFAERLRQAASRPVRGTVGFQGGNVSVNLYWLADQGIWFASGPMENRHWNAFGTRKPLKGRNHDITCEINFPFRGIDRRIAGAFAKDESGRLFVLHSGRIGGGRRGIGKALFHGNYTGEKVNALGGGYEWEAFLVGALGSKRLPDHVAHFVHEVERIKGLLARSDLPKQAALARPAIGFSPEFSGRKRYRVPASVDAQCDHGVIAEKLWRVIEGRGLKCGNDGLRDCYVVDSSDRVRLLFEVKTDVSRQSLYSAVGQLLLNSAGSTGVRNLVLVVPTGLSREVESTLNQLKIRVLPYRWKGHNVEFPLLARLLQDIRM